VTQFVVVIGRPRSCTSALRPSAGPLQFCGDGSSGAVKRLRADLRRVADVGGGWPDCSDAGRMFMLGLVLFFGRPRSAAEVAQSEGWLLGRQRGQRSRARDSIARGRSGRFSPPPSRGAERKFARWA